MVYDGERTKDMVSRMIALYKKYRHILESDLIHLRRANGRTIDYMLHVNPKLSEKGFLSVCNPTPKSITEVIMLFLYYTGVTDTAEISQRDDLSITYRLGRNYCVELPVTVPATSYTWFVVR